MAGDGLFLLGLIAAIAVLSGFVHSAIGFGFGIVAISLMPFVIDARSAHVVISASSVPMLIMAAWVYREGIDWASLKQALFGAAIFLPVGLALFEAVSLDCVGPRHRPWDPRHRVGEVCEVRSLMLMLKRGPHEVHACLPGRLPDSWLER